ncbi:MAG: hypothetical protein NZ602_13475 [Thermoguttaceae bacterium]|nr:hypothetical protein [Thermoguttaceae bacterium]
MEGTIVHLQADPGGRKAERRKPKAKGRPSRSCKEAVGEQAGASARIGRQCEPLVSYSGGSLTVLARQSPASARS